ncbi:MULTISPECIES: hypothetical protein [Streptomyces]|uniref:Secreted protein n=1 Tax=Streptomyces yunnanensis TaxID=156453 RepID=A0ABY8ACF0_9ACTN|nr:MULTISPECIES: hypothetical protein [Streptomyces]AJC58212.1 putative secreted protein [Streptomyces sp. 769]WEB42468.1 hypothetical protein MOV08_26600 [Streptomyces yunnanensis]
MDRGSSGRGLVHAAAWTLATGAAVALSWFGVHTVLSGTVYDAPRALPLSDQVASSALPQVSSTHRPKPSASPSASPSSSPADDRPPRTAAPSRSLDAPSSTSSALPGSGTPAPTGDRIRGYVTNGGRVVLSLGADSAELVSATPNAGWQMQVWKQNQWLRIDFTGGGAHTSVICTWNGHPPLVETSNHAA